MLGEITSTPRPEDDSPDIEGHVPDSANEQPLDKYFFVDFYDDNEHHRLVSKERRMQAAAHFLESMAFTAADKEHYDGVETLDPGPQLAMFVLMDDDPEVQKRGFDAISQAIDRGEVQGSIVASMVAELADLNRANFDAYKKLKDKTADQW